MVSLLTWLLASCIHGGAVLASPSVSDRSIQTHGASGPIVDLGYEVYQGTSNATTGLNTFLGIRFAQDTSGVNRWQAPKTPHQNRQKVIPALKFPPRCSQGPNAPVNYSMDYSGTEDCLFLSVFSPKNAKNLPVYVWIHGGGYGLNQGNYDLSALINSSDDAFVGVVIQYRLAAFGFLSSDEVAQFGTPNAGILDQRFALEWVQKYVSKFGGDKSRVTIAGQSAGGGSVMLQAMANNGTDGTKYFSQAIAMSPYLPTQYAYNAFRPSQSYYAFAKAAGCFNDEPYGNSTGTIFECLVSKPTGILQRASAIVSGSGIYGSWSFLPVTDGKLIQDIPSRQLAQGRVNGLRLLSSNEANEGVLFVPQTIKTEADFVAYVRQLFPLFNRSTITRVLKQYPTMKSNGIEYATSGTGEPGATALDVSQFATGQQQRANNLYAEATFVCPSYWLPEAFTMARSGGYKYQFSPLPSLHNSDIPPLFGPPPAYIGPDLFKAFQKLMTNFITTGNPSISSAIANGARNQSTYVNPASQWPKFSLHNPQQINVNETGGVVAENVFVDDFVTPYYIDPGRVNAISLVNADTWEGGRGARCEFWRSVGAVVPG